MTRAETCVAMELSVGARVRTISLATLISDGLPILDARKMVKECEGVISGVNGPEYLVYFPTRDVYIYFDPDILEFI